jgi:dienelactone hydrolase
MAHSGPVPRSRVLDLRPGVRRAVAALALALAGPGLAACTSGDGAADGDGAAGAAGTTGDGAPDDEDVPEGPFAVGRRDLTLVDATRGTDAVPDQLPAEPDRTLEVRVAYPVAGDPGPEPELAGPPEGSAMPDAEPVDGTFPLVVIGHGFRGHAENFDGWAARLAREGYVVAVPRFPLSNGDVGVLDDVENQPGDVSFLIDELGALDPDDDPLGGHVDGEQVAVFGHSLGAATVLGVTYNSCCADERIDAAIPVAGGPLPFDGGTYDDMPPVPMLLAHGEVDELVPVGASDGVMNMATGPVWYLRPSGADHTSVLFGDDGELLAEATVAFLDATLRDDDEALDEMADVVDASGLGEWRTAGVDEADAGTDVTGDAATTDG